MKQHTTKQSISIIHDELRCKLAIQNVFYFALLLHDLLKDKQLKYIRRC